MGSREESGHAQAKPVAAAAPVSQEVPSTPSVYPDWQSMAAYYGGAAAAGTPPAFFSPPSPSPYMWGGQHLMPPYGTPVPYHAMYPPGIYPHPAMAPGPTTMGVAEMEGRHEVKDRNTTKKSKGAGNVSQAPGKPANGVKETCTSANDDTSQSDGSGTEGSSNAGDQLPNQRDGSATGKRVLEKMNAEVLLPGKVGMASPATNLNIGMDIWNGSHAGEVPMKERPGAVNIAPSVAPSTIIGRDGVVPGNQWVQDERELKRQKRKESNRESARRSRQRKQQECEELSKKVEELTSDNNKLKNEINQLKQQCKLLESENISIREEYGQIGAPELLSTIEGNNNNSSVTQSSRQ